MDEIHNGIYMPTRSGAWTFLRPIAVADRPHLEKSLQHLSPESLYQRFLTPVSRLSEAQWTQLLDVDQERHVAWGILPLSSDDLSSAGVGRFIRLDDDESVAEFALTVTDASQGQGLGTILLALLIWLARQKGIETLRGVIQQSNDRMIAWMQRLGATIEYSSDGAVIADLAVQAFVPANGSYLARLFQRLDTLNVGPPEDLVPTHPHHTILSQRRS